MGVHYNLHATHGDEWDQSHLGPSLELEMPYQETRDDSEREVGHYAKGTVRIRKSYDKIVCDARSSWVPSGPEIVYRVALENYDEKKGPSSHDRRQHRCVKDPGVDAFDTDSQ